MIDEISKSALGSVYFNEAFKKCKKLYILGQLTSINLQAVLSVTFVNAALVVGPEEQASCNIRRHSHWV